MKTPSCLCPRLLVHLGGYTLLGLGALACPKAAVDDSPIKTLAENASPEGSVAGEILDLSTGLDLDGVTVNLLMGAQSFSATTAAGMFAFTKVSAGGTGVLTAVKPGYLSARMGVTLAAAAGTFPSGNNSVTVGPLGLFKVGDPLVVEVLRQDGTAAANLAVLLDLAAGHALYNGTRFVVGGDSHETATTNDQGVVQFHKFPAPAGVVSRFPDLIATVTASAIPTSDSDPGNAGAAVAVKFLDLLTQGNGNRVRLVLPPVGIDPTLRVMASTLLDLVDGPRAAFPGTVAPGEAEARTSFVRVVFNVPVLFPSVEGTLVTEDGETLTGVTGAINRLVVLRPADQPPLTEPLTGQGNVVDLLVPALSAGTEANLVLNATAARGALTLRRAAPVYVATEATLAVVGLRQVTVNAPVDNALSAGEVVDVILNQPVGGRPGAGESFQNITVHLQTGATRWDVPGSIAEPALPAPYVSGGFSTHVRFTATTTGPAAAAHSQVFSSVRVDFNEATRRDGGPANGGNVAVITPSGVVVDSAAGAGITMGIDVP